MSIDRSNRNSFCSLKLFKIQAGFSGLIDRNAWLHFSQIIQLTHLYLLTDLPNTSNSNSLCFCIDTKWMKITWKPTWVSPWVSLTRSRQWRSWTPWSQWFHSCLRRNFGTHSNEVSSFIEGFWWFEKILIFIAVTSAKVFASLAGKNFSYIVINSFGFSTPLKV